MRYLLWVGILGFLVSCGPSAPELQEAATSDIPASFAYKGEPVDVRTWTDDNGQNLLLFSKSEFPHEDTALTVALYAYHLLVKVDTFELLRTEQRRERNCSQRNLAFFSDRILLTDLDRNGIGEVTFAHYGGCSDTEVQMPVRQVMFEDGKIFVIRGRTQFAKGQWSRKRVEFSFFFCPPEFLNFANHQWRSYTHLISASI